MLGNSLIRNIARNHLMQANKKLKASFASNPQDPCPLPPSLTSSAVSFIGGRLGVTLTPTNGPSHGPTWRSATQKPPRRRLDWPCDRPGLPSAEGLPSLPSLCFVLNDQFDSSSGHVSPFPTVCATSSAFCQVSAPPSVGCVGCCGGSCPPCQRTPLHVLQSRQSWVYQ